MMVLRDICLVLPIAARTRRSVSVVGDRCIEKEPESEK